MRLLRPDRKDGSYTHGNLGGACRWIESVNHTLKGQLGLEEHGGRTTHGVFTRVGNVSWRWQRESGHNWNTGNPAKRSLIAFDH